MLCIASMSIEIVVDNKRGVEDDHSKLHTTESFFHKLLENAKIWNEKATILLINEFIIPTQYI